MKTITLAILFFLTGGSVAQAGSFTIPWNGTTTSGTVLTIPAPVNGIRPIPYAPYFIGTSTTASSFPYASTTSFTSSGFTYLATGGGNVGIGTTNPGFLLDVQNSGTGVQVLSQIKSAGGGFKLGSYGSGWGGFWSSGVTPATNNYSLIAHATAGTALNAPSGGAIQFDIADAVKLNLSSNGGLALGYAVTDPGAGSMIISGNVGIGTTSPTQKLSVQGSTLISGSITSVANITATGTITIAGFNVTVPATTTAILLAQTASIASVNTFTPTASSTYMIVVSTDVTAEAVQTLTVSVTYTDTGGTSRTQNFFGMGLTTAAIGSTGDSNFPPMIIRPLKNTAITVSTTVSGVGSIVYDIDASIIPTSTR